jgi:hypothetical protein
MVKLRRQRLLQMTFQRVREAARLSRSQRS